jgi:hypothetical protein
MTEREMQKREEWKTLRPAQREPVRRSPDGTPSGDMEALGATGSHSGWFPSIPFAGDDAE